MNNNSKEKDYKEKRTFSGPSWYGGDKLPCFTTNPTSEEFLLAHDQACDIIQDNINEQHKMEIAAEDPQIKRLLVFKQQHY